LPVSEFFIDHIRESNVPYTQLPEGYIVGDLVDINDDNFDEVILGSN